MNNWGVVITDTAKKQIEDLPVVIRQRVAGVIWNVLRNSPYIGKALKADLKGMYSYRIGDYRIIYSLAKRDFAIQIIKVMHRREVYR